MPVGGSCNEGQIGRRIEQPVQCLTSSQGGVRIHGLVDLREGIEQAPEAPWTECFMSRMPPLVEHIGDLRWCDRLAIHRPDHEIVGSWIVDGFSFVGIDALIELVETIPELSNGSCCQVAQVSHRIACVFAADADFSRERKIVANKHPCSSNQASRIGLVVAVPDTHYP